MKSITIIRTKNISAIAIHIGMWLWAVLRGLKTRKCYNHVEIRFGDETSGAISEGVKTRLWIDYLRKFNGKYFKYLDYNLELSDEEYEKGLNYLKNAEETPYEFENFWWHLVKIIFGKWYGSKTSRKTYCYEHAIRFLNSTGKYNIDPFLNPYEFKDWADKNLK
jgi:hypothetical protein